MIETWLITGVCGFIGTNLSLYLSQRPDIRIIGLDNMSVGSRAELAALCPVQPWVPGARVDSYAPGTVFLCEGDITDFATVEQVAQGVDVVVHLAADSGVVTSLDAPLDNFRVNAQGTLHVLEAVRSRPETRCVVASTGAALGQQEPPVKETHVPHPISPYGASKLAGEAYCQAYAGSYGLSTCALRFSNVYGPHSTKKTSAVARFIRQILAGESITIFGDGEQTRDFLYVEDLVAGILAATRQPQEGEVYHIATGQETTINALFAELSRALASAGVIPTFAYAPVRAGEILRNYASIEKAKERLGWAPTHTLAQGLERTIAWFLAQRGESGVGGEGC